MKIIKELGSFETDYFNDVILDIDGKEVTDYTYTSPSSSTATVDSKYIVSGVTGLNISKGDVVGIVGTDGIEQDFIVIGAGTDVIKLLTKLSETVGAEVTVKTKKYVVTFGAELTEGQYTTDANDVIIVANTFSNCYINKAFIQNRYPNLDDNKNIDLLNDDAKEALIGDFALNPHFYKTLDLGQLTELMKRKILSILELGETDRDSNNQPLTDQYDKLVNNTVNILNTIDDNTPNGDATDPDTMPSAVDFSWSNRASYKGESSGCVDAYSNGKGFGIPNNSCY